MSNVDQNFVDFLGTKVNKGWLDEVVEEYENSPACFACNGTNLEIIVDACVIFKCKDCSQATEGISIDKIRSIDYNAVTFLHEDKIREILASKAEGQHEQN